MINCKRVVILGATGSIGESALKVARDIPERMAIAGLAAHRNARKLAAQANATRAEAVCIVDESCVEELRAGLDYEPVIFSGESGLSEIASFGNADMVLVAVVGTGGLRPALSAVEAGKDIAVASKEILVMAGEIVMNAAKRQSVRVLPVDSEHNAIFQCLEGRQRSSSGRGTTFDVADVRRVILTASGGPFRNTPAAEFEQITPAQALRHPTWEMGRKVTIDSATLFNKGLEMIEARWLFDVEMARVDVVIHPQSIVHSMVEFVDGSVLAQLSHSDMCFPIQYAVTWPDRVPNTLPPLDFSKVGKLEFYEPRHDDFPALRLARLAGETGGTLPAVLNAANEIAVAAFLDGALPFPGIWRLVEQVMRAHRSIADASLDAILAADRWARDEAAARLRD